MDINNIEPSEDKENSILTSEDSEKKKKRPGMDWGSLWERLIRLGLGEFSLRFGTGLLSIALILLVIWVMGKFYLNGQTVTQTVEVQAASTSPTDEALLIPPEYAYVETGAYNEGVSRMALLHTILPAKSRNSVIEYTVAEGDTIFGIAEMFNLSPETVLWGNYHILIDDPHRLAAGQTLFILPVDGVYYEWHAGDGLNGVAEFYGVTPEDIVSFEGNNLNSETIGDYANPNIAPGSWLVIPGGEREFVNWSAPRITRDNPAVAQVYGPGYCGEVMDGPIGNGTFIWPTTERWLSGYDYSPETNHWGIDVAGMVGNAIFAVDSGVVVYAGWNDWGYGEVVVIDHGNGWQSLYAHLSSYNVDCGTYVYQGDVIAGLGSTGNSSGPHLHFELRSDEHGRVNPWNFLQ